SDVIGAVEVALVDLVARYKTVDVDGVVALDLNRLQFFRLDLDILSLAHLIAAALLVALDDVAGLDVDHLLLQPVAGLPVDHVETGLLDAGSGRIKYHRARYERQFESAFPVGARSHRLLQILELSGEFAGS